MKLFFAECEDLLEDCPRFAAKGECSLGNNTHNCPVSCNGTCDLAALQRDRSIGMIF